MIFFFGTRSTLLGQILLRNLECPYCHIQNSFTAHLFGSYAHFFWIPMFPLSKTYVAECSHCKKTYRLNDFTPAMYQSLENELNVNPIKRPIWHWSGLIILGLLIGSIVFVGIIGAATN